MPIDHISWWPSCIVLSCLNTMSIHRSQYTTRLQHCRSITKKDCEWRDQIIFLHAKLLSKWLKKFLYVIWLKIYFNFNSYIDLLFIHGVLPNHAQHEYFAKFLDYYKDMVTLNNPLNSKKTTSSCTCSAILTTIPIFKRLYISA